MANQGDISASLELLTRGVAIFLALGVTASAVGDERPAGGIWKAVVPHNMQGEFDNEDPMGLIAGKHIPADCSINWVSDKGSTYCFASATSLVVFLDMPNTNVQKARAFWEREKASLSVKPEGR